VEDVGSHCPHCPTSAQGRTCSSRAAGKSDSCAFILDCTCSQAAGRSRLLNSCAHVLPRKFYVFLTTDEFSPYAWIFLVGVPPGVRDRHSPMLCSVLSLPTKANSAVSGTNTVCRVQGASQCSPGSPVKCNFEEPSC
jgi:hypothetical protein